MLGYYAQSIIYCWWGQKSRSSKGQIHLIIYNFASNCHRDFKLGSCFSLWETAPNMTLTLKSSPKSKFLKHQLRKTSQNMLGYYAQDIINGWYQRTRSRSSNRSIHLIDYNFVSNCHRDFKLGSYLSLWKAAPNMTLKSLTKVKIFETYQIRKTSQNMLGYYAQGIIYCWGGQRSRSRSRSSKKVKFT